MEVKEDKEVQVVKDVTFYWEGKVPKDNYKCLYLLYLPYLQLKVCLRTLNYFLFSFYITRPILVIIRFCFRRPKSVLQN